MSKRKLASDSATSSMHGGPGGDHHNDGPECLEVDYDDDDPAEQQPDADTDSDDENENEEELQQEG